MRTPLPSKPRRISVHVTVRASEQSVRRDGDLFHVRVTSPAEDGRANMAVRRLLAIHFEVPISHVTIFRGLRNRNKIVDIAA